MIIENFNYSPEKNELLINTRGVSFEEVIEAIRTGDLIDIKPHPNQRKYPTQEIFIVNIEGYVYMIPFVYEDSSTAFLKTIFPTRKLTKQHLKESHHE